MIILGTTLIILGIFLLFIVSGFNDDMNAMIIGAIGAIFLAVGLFFSAIANTPNKCIYSTIIPTRIERTNDVVYCTYFSDEDMKVLKSESALIYDLEDEKIVVQREITYKKDQKLTPEQSFKLIHVKESKNETEIL